MSILFDAIQYYFLAAGVTAALVLVAGGLWWRGHRRTHTQPVYGPCRENVRRVK
mgnify:CR=1 FL=1